MKGVTSFASLATVFHVLFSICCVCVLNAVSSLNVSRKWITYQNAMYIYVYQAGDGWLGGWGIFINPFQSIQQRIPFPLYKNGTYAYIHLNLVIKNHVRVVFFLQCVLGTFSLCDIIIVLPKRKWFFEQNKTTDLNYLINKFSR